jgi:hypothetical protein
MSEPLLVKVDHSAIKVNQAMIVGLNVLAFLLNAAWLAGVVALVMVIGTLLKLPGFSFIYRYALKPAGLVKPEVLMDNPEPHRFAQGLGGVVMIGGVLALVLGAPFIGWGLIWLVVALAALNLFTGFCAGCAVYYWLGRLKVPGFYKSPPDGTFPGMRPRTRSI